MAVQAIEPNIQPLRRSFQVARRRLWWQRGIRTAVRSLCASLGIALAAALLSAWQAPEPVLGGFWMAAASVLLVGLIAALALRPSASQAARAVDLRLGLRQQLGTAEELLSRGTRGGLASLQIARASDLATGLPISRAFPLLPRREAGVALLLALPTAAVLVLVSLGMTLPNPFSIIRLPSFFREAPKAEEQDPFSSQREAARPRSAALEPLRQMLDQIQRQSQKSSPPPLTAAAALAQANAELNRIANESRIRQEALDNLAGELRGTAAGREVAESLRQGNYERAAEQLREMGQKSDQLSASAKQELAEALDRAAQRSQEAQELSSSERNAAEALQKGDYSSVVQSTDQLAQAVQNAASQMVPQSELADSWKRLEQLNRQFGQPGSQNNPGQGALSPPVAQSTQGAGERRGELQPGALEAQQAGASDQNQGEAPGGMPGRQPGGGAPGNGPGDPPLGNPNPRLGPEGNPLDVQGKIGDRFPGESASDPQAPSVLREGKSNSGPSSLGGEASGPISVPAENVFVPGDRRPTVRDYFSRGSGER